MYPTHAAWATEKSIEIYMFTSLLWIDVKWVFKFSSDIIFESNIIYNVELACTEWSPIERGLLFYCSGVNICITNSKGILVTVYVLFRLPFLVKSLF